MWCLLGTYNLLSKGNSGAKLNHSSQLLTSSQLNMRSTSPITMTATMSNSERRIDITNSNADYEANCLLLNRQSAMYRHGSRFQDRLHNYQEQAALPSYAYTWRAHGHLSESHSHAEQHILILGIASLSLFRLNVTVSICY